jgi:hypothetical protein
MWVKHGKTINHPFGNGDFYDLGDGLSSFYPHELVFFIETESEGVKPIGVDLLLPRSKSGSMKRNNSMTRLPDEALISAPKNRADMEVVQYGCRGQGRR